MKIAPLNIIKFNFRSKIKNAQNANSSNSIDNKEDKVKENTQKTETLKMSRQDFIKFMIEQQKIQTRNQKQKQTEENKETQPKAAQEKPKKTRKPYAKRQNETEKQPIPTTVELSPVLSEYTETIKKLSPVEKVAYIAEYSIGGDLEDKIYEYHNYIRKLLMENAGENRGSFNSKGVKYDCMHNFRTIQITQFYKGRPCSYDYYYYGYPNGRLQESEERTQTAFIYPRSYDPDGLIEYCFRDYNLDDVHGDVDVLIDNNQIIGLSTGRSMFAPYKAQYSYDKNGDIKSARITVYNNDNNEDKIKNSKVIFDKAGKVQKIFYDISLKPYTQEYYAKEVYERDEAGNFILVSEGETKI